MYLTLTPDPPAEYTQLHTSHACMMCVALERRQAGPVEVIIDIYCSYCSKTQGGAGLYELIRYAIPGTVVPVRLLVSYRYIVLVYIEYAMT